MRWLRLVALAVAVVLELTSGELSTVRVVLLIVVGVYTGARFVTDVAGRPLTTAALVVVGGALVLTDGLASPYAPYAVVATLAAGSELGPTAGGALGALMSAAAVAPVAFDGNLREVDLPYLVGVATTLPLIGLVGGLARRLRGRDDGRASEALVEANRILSELHAVARQMPGGLRRRPVAAAVLDELHDSLGPPASALLIADGGVLQLVAENGLPGDAEPVHEADLPRPLRDGRALNLAADALPPSLRAVCGGFGTWLLQPLEFDGRLLGLLLVATTGTDRKLAGAVRDLAQDASLALKNAELFAQIEEFSASAERRRLANDLHDGVAQSLAHLRLELDLLARDEAADGAAIRAEVSRLSRVVNRALAEVRASIRGLRATAASDDLVAALQAHVRDLRGVTGTAIEFEARGQVALDDQVKEHLYRIAQEAISNALRHANARTVWVSLEGDASEVELVVEDDGRGFDARRAAGTGVGLTTMRERSQLIGADLHVRPRRGGGTVVRLRSGHRRNR